MPVFTPEAPATIENHATEASSERLTMEQATALFHLLKTFRPEWADWKTVMGRLQDTAMYSALPGHLVVALVIEAAAKKPAGWSFEDLPFLGINPYRDDNYLNDEED